MVKDMMMDFALRMWKTLRDERGIETGEWIAILAVVLFIAYIVYGVNNNGGTLNTALTGVITQISTSLKSLNP